MATYYVSTAGNDGWPGTEAQPWQTIAYAVTRLTAGDVLRIRGSANPASRTTYSEVIAITAAAGCESGTSGSRITVTNYPGEYVRIAAPSQNHCISIEGLDYWTISGSDSNLGVEIDQNGWNRACVNLDEADFITLEYLECHNANWDAILNIYDSNDVTVQYCEIYDNAALAGTDHHAVMFINSTAATMYRPTVRGCTIYDAAGDGVVFDNGSTGLIADVVVEDNEIYTTLGGASENAVDLKAVNGADVRRNTMHGFRYCNGTLGSSGSNDGSSIVSIIEESSNIRVYDNVFYNYSCAGVYCYRPSVSIYRNLFRDAVNESGIPTYLKNHIYLTHFSGTPTVDVVKNTFVGTHGGAATSQVLTMDPSVSLTVNYRDNCHSATGGFNIIAGTISYSYNGWFASPAETLAGTGDVSGPSAGFSDDGADDFRLAAGSACINAGTIVSPYTDGYRGSAPDIGYHERPAPMRRSKLSWPSL